MDCSCVREKAEVEQESEEEVEEVDGTLENVVYSTTKQSRVPGKKGRRTRRGDENRASGAQASPPDDSAAAGTDSQLSASKKAKFGSQAWKDRFNGSKKN